MSGKRLAASDLDERAADAVQRLVLTLADSKRMMGIRYSDWLLGAPSIETGIATSAMTQDEWGHARLLYAMLKAFDVDPKSVEHDRAPDAYRSVATLDTAFPDWAAVVAAIVLTDGAISVMLRAFSEGRYQPARSRVPKMLAEEEFHSSLGAAWFKRLAVSEGDARRLLAEACAATLPALLAWVGTADDADRALAEAGVIASAAERRAAFEEAVTPLLALVDIDPAAVEAATDWDEERGRTAGHPEEEAVERARGDRNRALFVE